MVERREIEFGPTHNIGKWSAFAIKYCIGSGMQMQHIGQCETGVACADDGDWMWWVFVLLGGRHGHCECAMRDVRGGLRDAKVL